MIRQIMTGGMAAWIALAAAAGAEETAPARQRSLTINATVDVEVHMNYLLYLPAEYEKDGRAWPLMLFLHGAGERGDNLDLVKKHGPPKLVESGRDYSFIIASPQCPKDAWWSDDVRVATLDALLTSLATDYRVDRDRIYLTGLSMGGFGTWRLATAYPDRFAAIVPICGRGDPAWATRIRRVPAWVFHGAKDEVVPLQGSQDMVDALKALEAPVQFTVYPEAGHDSWTETYNNPALYDWLLKQRRAP